MKCFIIDTLIGIFAVDEVGNIINFIDFNDDFQRIIVFYTLLDSKSLQKEYEVFLKELNTSGFNEYFFDNKQLEEITSFKLKYKTFYVKKALEFRDFRFNLQEKINSIGLSKTEEELLATYKKVEQAFIRKKVKEAGEQDDIIVIQTIETLEILKKSISLFMSRLREWYGLHFPELTDKLVEDNIILAEMILSLGNRENFTFNNIKRNFEFTEKRIEKIQSLASNSMGADIDLKIIQEYANQVLSLDKYRNDLENYLDNLMEKFAPNLTTLVGSLIGAKLISKAGNLKKLAYMPASRIQLLGAEKALYRFLKTGEKQPKHGLIFQWNLIRGSRPWNRGKISRLISGKIGITAKVDYFGGDFIADSISKEIEDKIKEIEIKYPKPPLVKKKPQRMAKKQKKKKLRR
ncbi:MAG: C/D box methylation guide ribonucleoprotein complex aNOP56 subunit [Candidatus Thorarchaeota archaeon]